MEEKGTLLARGLIAGEAILGILLAVTCRLRHQSLTQLLTGAEEFGWFADVGGWLSLRRIRGGRVGADPDSAGGE